MGKRTNKPHNTESTVGGDSEQLERLNTCSMLKKKKKRDTKIADFPPLSHRAEKWRRQCTESETLWVDFLPKTAM